MDIWIKDQGYNIYKYVMQMHLTPNNSNNNNKEWNKKKKMKEEKIRKA